MSSYITAVFIGFALLAAAVLTPCAAGAAGPQQGDMMSGTTGGKAPYPPSPIWKNTISLKSDAFGEGERIPQRHTGDGENVSPALSWSNLPSGTKEIVLMLEDPDGTGGNFSHWIIYGISPETMSLPEAVPAKPEVEDPTARQGVNSLLKMGYAGPAPVPGSGTHHYTFRIFAMKKTLDVKPGATKEDLQKQMYTHVLAQGVLTGTYSRSEK